MKKSIVLVDGSFFLFRSLYTMPYFCTKDGYFTGCILGFVNSLQKIIEINKPSCCLVVFDNKGKNFRHIIYSKYKKNRKKIDIDLTNQIKDIYLIIRYMGLTVINIPNIETDDIIGSISYRSYNENILSVIVSNDKDFNQLINKRIYIYIMNQKKIY